MNRLRAFCPAKVNLGLNVLGRRSDGFHEIVTIFQAIDLCDVLEGEVADEVSLEVSDRSIPSGESNLVLKAARLLGRRVDRARGRGARLALHKEIPVESGLGGGSSNAAGALMLLNELWALQLGLAELTPIAEDLGSDVPFFCPAEPLWVPAGATGSNRCRRSRSGRSFWGARRSGCPRLRSTERWSFR